MAIGPGKYDDLATYCREKVNAPGVLLILTGGNRGPGFSAQLTAEDVLRVPAMLRAVADQIEATQLGDQP